MTNSSNSPHAPLFNLSQITPWNKGEFHTQMKRALFSYLMGLSYIEVTNGESNDLKNKWMYYEWAAIQQGRVAVIIKGGELMMLNSNEIISLNRINHKPYTTKSANSWEILEGKNNNGLTKDYKINYYYNSYFEYSEMTALIDGKEETFKKGDFAILDNNVEGLPSLLGCNYFLDFLAQKLEQISYDAELSKKMLLFLTPEKPAEKDWGDMLISLKIGYVGFMAFPNSAEPDTKENRKGFDLSQVQFQIYQPEGQERTRLWEDFKTMFDLMLWTFGICFDVLKDKAERASVSEVSSAVDYFVCREREKKQTREAFLRAVELMFSKRDKPVKFELHYGRHSSKNKQQ